MRASATKDRRCRPSALDNPLRRWLAPAHRDRWLLAPAPGQVVVDLGAGVGFHAGALRTAVGPSGTLFLVDIDEENLALARDRIGTPPNTSFLLRSATDTGLPSEAADRVVLSFVLCCVADKEGTLDEAWRILRPGGLVFVSFPRTLDAFPRFRPLRVTRDRWESLRARRGWRLWRDGSGGLVRRYVLEKPLEGSPS